MENEKMIQEEQPTYEQLVRDYNNLVREFENVRLELNAVKTDKFLEKLNAVLGIIKDKDFYSDKLVSLAKWNAEQMLAKPKN